MVMVNGVIKINRNYIPAYTFINFYEKILCYYKINTLVPKTKMLVQNFYER